MRLAGKTLEALGAGRRLFNDGKFFEAHEAWEEAWLGETREAKQLLQGLIQIAAGYHQAFDRAAASGCRRLLEAGRAKLQTLAPDAAGLDLAAFLHAVELSLAQARAWEGGEGRGLTGPPPQLRLSKE